MANSFNGRRNSEIDALRAFAVVLVVAYHATFIFQGENLWDAIVHHWFDGSSGVDLFFVISGFVISATFIPKFDASVAAGDGSPIKSAFDFYFRRIRRLCPAALFWAFAVFVGNSVMQIYGIGIPVQLAFEKLIAATLYVSNFSEAVTPTVFGYFWSLSLEMQFYLAFPIFLYFVKGAFLRGASLSALFLLITAWNPFGPVLWTFRFQGLLLGVILYQLTQAKVYSTLLPANPSKTLSLVFTLALLALIAVALLPLRAYPSFAYSMAGLLSGALVLAATYERGFISNVLPEPLISWLGSRSYSLYLCHIPLMLMNRVIWIYALSFSGRELDNSYWLGLLITSTALMIVISEATYRLLEEPFLRSPSRQGEMGAAAPQMAATS